MVYRIDPDDSDTEEKRNAASRVASWLRSNGVPTSPDLLYAETRSGERLVSQDGKNWYKILLGAGFDGDVGLIPYRGAIDPPDSLKLKFGLEVEAGDETPLLSREQAKEDAESFLIDLFDRPNLRNFLYGEADYGRVWVSLKATGSVKYVVDSLGNLSRLDGKKGKPPQTLINLLGKTKMLALSDKQAEIDMLTGNAKEIMKRKKAREELEKEKGHANAMVDQKQKELNANLKKLETATGKDKERLEKERQSIINELDTAIKASNRLDHLDGYEDVEVLNQELEQIREQIGESEEEVEEIWTRMSLKEKVKYIFKKYGVTVVGVLAAVGTVIGVIVSNLSAGLSKVAKGVGNGLKEIGKKLGQILPGMVGAIVSFLFNAAGSVISFLGKNAWLLILLVVTFVIDQFKVKKQSRSDK